jgi:hypothetical protein
MASGYSPRGVLWVGWRAARLKFAATRRQPGHVSLEELVNRAANASDLDLGPIPWPAAAIGNRM